MTLDDLLEDVHLSANSTSATNNGSSIHNPSSSVSAVSGSVGDRYDNNDTSPKPILRTTAKESSLSKRSNVKMHHVNKGKQQRDRRKLREKRRSTGVVHLASTESTTGGSTTGDDDESSTEINPNAAANAGCSASLASTETKRNTQLNESLLHHHHHHHHRKRHDSNEKDTSSSSKFCHKSNSGSANLYPAPPSILRNSVLRSRAKSPSDLEADDENDHDSLNQSESSSNFSSSNHLPGLGLSTEETTTMTLNMAAQSNSCQGLRSNTPICASKSEILYLQ